MKLTDRVAIVTGAARGIGRAIALGLAEEGANLVVCDLDTQPLDEVAGEVKAIGRQVLASRTDVTRSGDVNALVDAALDRFGAIDILVNNAGGSARERSTAFHESSEEVWDLVIARNLKSTLLCTRAVINHMMDRRSGKIINMGSTVGIVGGAGVVDYSAAKAGVIGFTKALAREVKQYEINVNVVAPGLIDTEAHRQIPSDIIEDVKRRIEVTRAGTPEDIAKMVLFLSSEDASYVTGHVFVVDGGGWIA